MKICGALSVVVLVVLGLASPASFAVPVKFKADLSGAAEAPPNASPGSGKATVLFDQVAHTMQLDVTFSGLLGNVTASHIHCCTLPTASVATTLPSFPGFPTGVTSGSYSNLFDLTNLASFSPGFVAANGGTAAGAEAALFAGLNLGDAYLNIHTASFPGGEIRGFFAVSEPSVLLLTGGALGSLLITRRRRNADVNPGATVTA